MLMDRLIFLGTGGGGYVMFGQIKRTGGLYFEFDDEKAKKPFKFILDPGPGSLVFAHALGLKPETLSGIVLTHVHIDHSSDANVLLDRNDNAFLIAEEHCVKSKEELKERKPFDEFPCITLFHRNHVKELHIVKPDQVIKIGNTEFHAIKTKHYSPGVGFKIRNGKYTIGYVGDGSYYQGQEKYYDNCDVLILNVLVPKGMKSEKGRHMSVDDAIALLKGIKEKPRLVVIQHLSMWMLRANIYKQVKIIRDATKLNVIHAEDFMELNLKDLTTRQHDVKIVVK
jgi:ribonuclease BN (tRNA processing enzyme)